MDKGKVAKRTSGNSEVRAQIWEEVILDLFVRHHGMRTKREIAKLLGRGESTVNGYFKDPATLGHHVIEVIASAFESLETKAYVFKQWNSLQLNIPDDGDERAARKARLRRQGVRESLASIVDYLRIETLENGRYVALGAAYSRCMLNKYFWEAASYLPEMEQIAESTGDTIATASCMLHRFQVLRNVGFSNLDYLVSLLRKAQQLLDSSTESSSSLHKLSTTRIAVTVEQVSFTCERLTYDRKDHRSALLEMDERLSRIWHEAHSEVTKAEVCIRRAQIYACLGDVKRAETFLARGRKEAGRKFMPETHATIVEIMILRAKGDQEKAVELALAQLNTKAVVQDEYHKRIIIQQVVEIILDVNRYGKPAPEI